MAHFAAPWRNIGGEGDKKSGSGNLISKRGNIGERGLRGLCRSKASKWVPEGWLAMSQDALTVLQQFTRVEDFRVLMALLARLDFENLLVVNQADIARDLNMRREHVNHAIKRLITAGALLEGPRIGVSRSYRLNPKFGWKGSAKGHVIALSDYRREQPTTEQDTPRSRATSR